MDQAQQPSTALARKRSAEMALMPPPPQVKKIKRPKRVLDEETYTETLSHIIARDYFPGLLETETKQEYLDALDSKDQAWIASAGKRLEQVMTPGRGKGGMQNHRRPATDGARTPTTFVGDTPASEASVPSLSARPRVDAQMSLTTFQQTYTSEDNESFYKLIDKQNQKRADKYAWLWRGNKLPSKQMIKQKEVQDRLASEGRLLDDGYMKRDRLAIKGRDDRPARPDSWQAAPKNNFMYVPDGVETGPASTSAGNNASSRGNTSGTIVRENTRIPEPFVPKRPPSPTASSIRDAVAGHPRARDQDSSVAGGETPRVNGYAFVDDEEEDEPDNRATAPVIDLGPGDANNPFKVQDVGKRESLRDRMVERISNSKKSASRSGVTGRVDQTPVPKFPSSPSVKGNLTPAAQRLWSKIGTPRGTPLGGNFGQSTPMKPRGSLLRSVSRASDKGK